MAKGIFYRNNTVFNRLFLEMVGLLFENKKQGS